MRLGSNASRILHSVSRLAATARNAAKIQNSSSDHSDPLVASSIWTPDKLSQDSDPVEWNIPRSRQPWSVHFGLKCPTDNSFHQPHPTPWWSGESVFALEGQRYRQPEGPFYHVLLYPNSLSGENGEVLQPEDYLLSPAQRQVEVRRIEGRIAEDGCIAYTNYDVHAVYVSTRRPPASVPGTTYYEVEPEGLLWPDPERPIREDWCCARAKIVAVHQFPADDEISGTLARNSA